VHKDTLCTSHANKVKQKKVANQKWKLDSLPAFQLQNVLAVMKHMKRGEVVACYLKDNN